MYLICLVYKASAFFILKISPLISENRLDSHKTVSKFLINLEQLNGQCNRIFILLGKINIFIPICFTFKYTYFTVYVSI